MKIKNVNLKWCAFIYDGATHTFKYINVLYGMEAKIANKIKKGKKDNWRPVYNYDTFKEWLKGEFMYHYWSKAECEYVIGELHRHNEDTLEKHDIWWQLEPNLDRICEYVIREMKIEFKK